MTLKEIINKKFIEEFETRKYIRRYPYEMMIQKILIAEKSGQFDLPLTDEHIINLIVEEIKEKEELLNICNPEEEQYYILAKYTIKELSQYLPNQMSEEEVITIIKKLKETEADSEKLIDLTIKEVGNRFDKAKIAQLVKCV